MAKKYWQSPKFFEIISFFIIPLLLFGIYLHCLNYDFFTFDDTAEIKSNFHFHPVTLKNTLWFWGHSLMPVTYTLWATIIKMTGSESAAPFRFINLALHIFNSFLVVLITQRVLILLQSKKQMSSHTIVITGSIAGLLFASHPVHVEPVIWISSSKDLLSFSFGMISFYFFLLLKDTIKEGKSANRTQYETLLYISLIASAFSKPSGAVFFLVFAWLDLVFFTRDPRQVLKEYVPMFLLGTLALLILHEAAPPDIFHAIPNIGWRVLLSMNVLLFDLTQILIPKSYYFDYGNSSLELIKLYRDSPWIYSAAAILTAVGFGIFLLPSVAKKYKLFHFSIGFFVITALPFLGILPFIFQNISTTADRYLYAPSFGFCFLVAYLFTKVKNRIVVIVLILGLIVIYSVKSFKQSLLWQNSIIYLTYTLEKNPLSYASHVALAEELKKIGASDEAQIHLQIGLQIQRELSDFLKK